MMQTMTPAEGIPREVFEACGGETGDLGPFVLNLCPVPSPLMIPQPRAKNLVKYAFFVSRGMEDDRECFWLHMGYFGSREEAHKWREVLHRIYPLAFVTPASTTLAPMEHPILPGAMRGA